MGASGNEPPRPAGERPPRGARKDLKDLRKLPRSAFVSYQKKHAQPHKPRSRAQAARRLVYPGLSAFAPHRFWKWLTEYWRFRIGRRHPFQTYDGEDGDNGIYQLRGDAGEIRIALAGDWGTVPNPCYEFAPCKWPHGSEGAFALNGNHEMYALGYGYFDHILPKLGVRGAPRGQRASYFCLENDHWRIIALDTSYNSVGAPILEHFLQPNSSLPAPLIDWLRTVVEPRPDDTRGIVILSHHQYVSRFDHCYPKPAQQLAEFFSRPVLWLWGHEHRLAIYEEASMPGGVTAFGRCIGHGGMPVDVPPKIPLHDFAVEFIDERLYPNDENLIVGYNGFATMTLRDNQLTLDYVDLRGTRVFSETWAVDQSKLVRLHARRC
jgi:hypothetical protein